MRLLLYKIYRFILLVIAFLFGRRTYKRVVVIGKARTGSNLLLSYLNSHPNIVLEGELFGYLQGKSCYDIWNTTFVKKVPWVKWFGFKIFYEQPLDSSDREVWRLLERDQEILIIHLRRENILRSYLSHKIASENGQWTQSASAPHRSLERKNVSIDIADLLSHIEETKLNERDIATRFAKHQCYELTYEELASNPEGEMRKVFATMNLKDTKIRTKMIRQNPELIRDLVVNYADLCRALKETEYSHFLDEKDH